MPARLALMLRSCGINVNALPLLDVRQEGATDIIGDRALGSEPMQVAALGRAVLDGMASAGVVGIIKHMPGHGRALVDSHKELPVVTASADELESDLEPFERLASAPMGMTAHVVYTAWDAERPASLSPVVIRDIIRERIGFDGWLMSDDLGMEALQGDFASRARAWSRRAATSPSTARARWTKWSPSRPPSLHELLRATSASPAPWQARGWTWIALISRRKSPSATSCWHWSESPFVDRGGRLVD